MPGRGGGSDAGLRAPTRLGVAALLEVRIEDRFAGRTTGPLPCSSGRDRGSRLPAPAKVAERGGNERKVRRCPSPAELRRSRPCDSVGNEPRRDYRGGDRSKYEVAVDIDEAFARLDRREVALAGCAQAHDEAQGTGRDTCLIRVRDDRGIETAPPIAGHRSPGPAVPGRCPPSDR
jgi:hypothetical protein